MERSKDFYLGVINAIDFFLAGNKLLYPDKGKELSGNYWAAVYDFLRDCKGTYAMAGDILGMRGRDDLIALREDCQQRVLAIEKADDDRNVDRKYKIKGILYGRISLIVSILAFLLSLWVALRQAGIF